MFGNEGMVKAFRSTRLVINIFGIEMYSTGIIYKRLNVNNIKYFQGEK